MGVLCEPWVLTRYNLLVTDDVNSALSEIVRPLFVFKIVSFQVTAGVLLSVRISAFIEYFDICVITVNFNKYSFVYLPYSSSDESEMLKIKCYCKNI